MDISIELTRGFEHDLQHLSPEERTEIESKIDSCASLFFTDPALMYRSLDYLPFPSKLDAYDSSLYAFSVTPDLRVILAIDEDPIFDQVIFTLFRVVEWEHLHKAHQAVAESLYEEIIGQQNQSALLV
ncbi:MULTISPECIES: hypothetical protein [unclassified Synechocystis]|uniref:hypothetical protein n=1 Tax=unclassified Synechocystis TaxID=2640012 RepID=UPI00048F44A1|nr:MULTISPECIES: hypothetical protein [unclassified Synechocystis]AIE74473.2 hypothetical protein D082_19450 [Synechocystis sp. PCC 6714]MCT0254764.1 hypothetical protein [Synechocystis sp. CS-94]